MASAAKKVRQKTAKPAAKQSKKRSKKAAYTKTGIKPGAAKLTVKQETFIAEYLANGFNATQAAISAGYSAKTADSIACRLLKLPAVAAAIAAKQQPKLEKLEITADRVLAEIAKLAFFDVRKLYREDGSLIPITELDDETAAAVAGLEVYTEYDDGEAVGQTRKFKLADKGRNLERLGRHLKLFTDKIEHSGTVAIAWVARLSDEELEAQLKARGVKLEGK